MNLTFNSNWFHQQKKGKTVHINLLLINVHFNTKNAEQNIEEFFVSPEF